MIIGSYLTSFLRTNRKASFSRLAEKVLLGLVALTFVFHGGLNLNDSDFWIDEAGQYWMAFGQSHYSEFGTPKSSFSFRQAANSNLDPPGFGVLLRLWIEVFGDSTFALRALPFLFFVGTVLVAGSIGAKFFRVPFALGAVATTTVLSVSGAPQYSTELRAYSAEMFTVVAIVWSILSWVSSRSMRDTMILTFWLIFGVCFTRYSAVIAVMSAAGIVLFRMARERTKGDSLQLLLFGLAGLLTGFFLYWFSAILPNGPHSVPGYVNDLILRNADSLSAVLAILSRNFLSLEGLPLLFFLFAGLVLLFERNPKLSNAFTGWAAAEKDSVRVLHLFVLLYLCFSAGMSVAGLYPWDITRRWSIGLIGLSAISTIALVAIVSALGKKLDGAFATQGKKSYWKLPSSWFRVIVSSGVVAAFLVSAPALSSYEHRTYGRLATNVEVAAILKATFDREPEVPQQWFVEERLWPTFRVAVERDPKANMALRTAFLIPELGGSDQAAREFVSSNVNCPPRGEAHLLLRADSEDLPYTIAGLLIIAEESGCAMKVDQLVDEATFVTIWR